MGSQLQLCSPVGSQLLRKMHKVWLPLVWPLQPMLKLNQATWDMAMDMDTLWEVSALVLVFTLLDQSMSPDLPRALVRGALMLMLSHAITHRTTGHPLSLPPVTPPAMDAVVSVVLSQDILVLGMAMDMASEVSAEVLAFTQLGQSMSPDLPRVLVRGALMLMLSQDITHRTTGHPLSLPTVTPPAMDAVVSVVPSQDILVLGTDMDMASEVSAEVLVSTLLGQFMSPDQHRVSVVDTCTRLLLLLCNLLEINIC